MAESLISSLIRQWLLIPLGTALVGISERISTQKGRRWVEVNTVRLRLPRLAPEFNGYRIAHLSDLHMGTWLGREALDEALELVNGQAPDFLAITGDFVTLNPEKYAGDLVQSLRRVLPPDGSGAVLGNHDHWADARMVRKILSAAGIYDLSNRAITVKRGAARLHFAGVDDQLEKLDNLPGVLAQLNQPGCAVLLAHEPDLADRSAATRRFDLQLSGHTHGGQIVLPCVGPVVLPHRGQKYPAGLYRVGEMYQYTNRGLGTSEFQIRYRCPAEITILVLEAGG